MPNTDEDGYDPQKEKKGKKDTGSTFSNFTNRMLYELMYEVNTVWWQDAMARTSGNADGRYAQLMDQLWRKFGTHWTVLEGSCELSTPRILGPPQI